MFNICMKKSGSRIIKISLFDRYSIRIWKFEKPLWVFLYIFQLFDILLQLRKVFHYFIVRWDDCVLDMGLELNEKSKLYSHQNFEDLSINTNKLNYTSKSILIQILLLEFVYKSGLNIMCFYKLKDILYNFFYPFFLKFFIPSYLHILFQVDKVTHA